ncbi:MAG: ABC transporter ATP-binding protein [Polyangia bacterium]
METPLLQVTDLRLRYEGARDAVANVGFEIAPGSIFALVGPNGAGKTSILRMLATLQPPTAGRIQLCGIDLVNDPAEARRKLGFLPDNFSLYDRMTPVAYLEFWSRLYALSAHGEKARIDALLDELGLAEKRNALIGSLSRGMRQRLGLGRALIHEPKLLILDEPASALDPSARERLQQLLVRWKKRGLAIVISSHILPDLAAIADAVGIMERGRMVQSGSIADVARSVQGAQTLRIELCGGIDRARRVFGERGTKVEEPEPGCFELALEDDDAVAVLVEALVLRGARVRAVRPKESALEAVYRASAVAEVA